MMKMDRLKPTFLGIGVQKAGTSWLYDKLASHPDIFLPDVKELHYFDNDEWFCSDDGLARYLSHFPKTDDQKTYKHIGEVTPRYIYKEDAPERIKRVCPDAKMIVILRNPVERLYSQYKMNLAGTKHEKPFEDFMNKTDPFARGLYAEQLKRFYKHFPKDQILVLVYEHIFENDRSEKDALARIATFLDIDPTKFDYGHKVVNQTAGVPARKGLYRFAVTVKRGLGALVKAMSHPGVKKYLTGKAKDVPKMTDEQRKLLYQRYAADISELEKLLDISFDLWKIKNHKHGH